MEPPDDPDSENYDCASGSKRAQEFEHPQGDGKKARTVNSADVRYTLHSLGVHNENPMWYG